MKTILLAVILALAWSAADAQTVVVQVQTLPTLPVILPPLPPGPGPTFVLPTPTTALIRR